MIEPSKLESLIVMMKENEAQAEQGFKLLLKRPDFEDYFDQLKQGELFVAGAERNPQPVPEKEGYYTVPYWGALSYLEAVAQKARDTASKPLTEKILQVIRDVSAVRIDEKPLSNYYIYRSFIQIFATLPSQHIRDNDIDLIADWIHTSFNHGTLGQALANILMPVLLKSDLPEVLSKACRLLRISLAVEWHNTIRDLEGPQAVIENYWLKELVRNNTSALKEKCSAESAHVFYERLKEVYSRIEQNVPSWTARPAVEEHTQNHGYKDVENSLVEGLRDLTSAWVESGSTDAKQFVDSMLRSDVGMARRIAIYLVNKNFDLLKEFIIGLLPHLPSTEYLHEMYNLLEDRFAEFDETQKEATFKTIINLTLDRDGDKLLSARREQKRWLTAIKGKGLKKADDLLTELARDKSLGGLPKYPDFMSWMESRFGFGPTPYSVAEILSFLDKGTLIETLNQFKEPEQFWLDQPTLKALIETLEDAVSQQPQGFLAALPSFLSASRPYQYGVMNGLKKLWDKQVEGIDWDSFWTAVLSFMQSIIQDDKFWTEQTKESKDLTPTKAWIPSVVADFLRSGVRKDEQSIPAPLLNLTGELIVCLLDHSESEWDLKSRDAMTQAINTEKGRIIEALVDFTLFRARKEDKEKKSHKDEWKRIQPIFDKELAKCNGGNQVFSTLMGAYAAHLEYLDFEWLTANVEKIFPERNPENFICAVRGLTYAPASKQLYILLRDKGIILKALQTDFDADNARENFLERIAVSYIWGDDELNSDRFKYLFAANREADLYHIAKFFWRISGEELSDPQIARIVDFWARCVEWIDTQGSAPQSLLSALSLLSCYLEAIDETHLGWLLKSAPFVEKHHNLSLLLKELDELADVSPEPVKMIFLKILETNEPFSDFEGTIRSIILKLAAAGFRTDMLPVVDKLLRFDGFQELYKNLRDGA